MNIYDGSGSGKPKNNKSERIRNTTYRKDSKLLVGSRSEMLTVPTIALISMGTLQVMGKIDIFG